MKIGSLEMSYQWNKFDNLVINSQVVLHHDSLEKSNQ